MKKFEYEKSESNDSLKYRFEIQFDNQSGLRRESKGWVDWLVDWYINLNYNLKKQKQHRFDNKKTLLELKSNPSQASDY
jgi:hypothetical protein